MKYYLADYLTYDGEHEYSEYGVLSARDYASAEEKAKKGKKFFARFGWEEFCELFHIAEIPEGDFSVLGKYHPIIDLLLAKKAYLFR
jgi:hypothetical protein